MPYTNTNTNTHTHTNTETSMSDTGEHTGKHPRCPPEPPGRPAPKLHVAPRDGLWIVRGARSDRAIAAFATRDQAIARARRIAAMARSEVVVHPEASERAPHFHVTCVETLTGKVWLISDTVGEAVSAAFASKLAAVDAARELARERHGVLYIHGSDGAPDQVYHYEGSVTVSRMAPSAPTK